MDKKVAIQKWGWWAVIGLAVVLVIAGLVAVISALQPKPSTELSQAGADDTVLQGQAENQTEIVLDDSEELSDSGDSGESESAESVVGDQDSGTVVEDLPKTGPEDMMWLFVLLGFLSYGATLGISSWYEKRIKSRIIK